ncbi:MAG: S53 family peptidase, partial [Nitrososphaeraceae archaeon]|nr:S53 family peptidase [Nitrososphaeraceae archaeon]
PQVVSISWGWSEVDQCTFAKCNKDTSQEYVSRTNVELMKIGARGVSIVVASGDAGSPDRINEGCDSTKLPTGWNHINAVFPGGSPWVVSVGASYLVRSANSYNYKTPICKSNTCATGSIEQMTTFNQTGWTSGSAFTHWTPAPSWQVPLIQSYLKSGVALPNSMYYNSSNRAYPDVTAFGHNCAVYYDGQLSMEDGTSCSSPIFAGILTHLNAYQLSKGRPLLGYVNQLLYKLYEINPNSFHDILVGDSSCTEYQCCGREFGFLATKGFDPVSGLGSPNVGEIKKTLDKLFY